MEAVLAHHYRVRVRAAVVKPVFSPYCIWRIMLTPTTVGHADRSTLEIVVGSKVNVGRM